MIGNQWEPGDPPYMDDNPFEDYDYYDDDPEPFFEREDYEEEYDEYWDDDTYDDYGSFDDDFEVYS